ncbi:MAG: ribokinase [Chloroflexota bacterium]
MIATPRAPIVVAGGINLDMVVRVPRLPHPGETIHGKDLVQVPGGKGANQAAAVARLGGEARLLALVGDDDIGRRLLRSVGDDGIDARWLQVVPDMASGVALIAVADDGANTIIVAPGANARADAASVLASATALAGARVVMGQLEWPFGAVQALLKQAPEGAVRLLNAAPAEPRALELLPQVDWLIVNELEAGVLTGTTVAAEASALDAGERLCALGVAHAVITLGSKGAVLMGPVGTWVQPAPAVTVVDTTAAGDAFAGALAVALAQGLAEEEALRLAVAAGSLACTILGARPSLPTRAAVDHLLPRLAAGRRW